MQLQLSLQLYKAIFSYNKLLNIVESDDVLVLNQTVQNVQPKNARFVYLITYSQADLSLVLERASFVLLVIHMHFKMQILS
jgi:hypothetical protein